MKPPTRASYIMIAAMLLLVGWFKLATPLLTVLFSLFALHKLHLAKHRWGSITVFCFLVVGTVAGFIYFLNQAFAALPTVASKSIPIMVEFLKQYGVELPFDDIESLREAALDLAKNHVRYVGSFAKGATRQIVFVILGLVVAASIFLDGRLNLGRGHTPENPNFYALICDELSARFKTFFKSFETVMGAQMLISLINTGLTAVFIMGVGLPHEVVVIGATFLCGLIPIVGNLLSNTIIVGIALAVSLKMAILALLYLVVLHKLEYFLNSKIIGHRIENPVWLTLIALIVGERLMGIPGMILAPVVLHYIKVEASKAPA